MGSPSLPELSVFLDDLKFGRYKGSYTMASKCVDLLLKIVNESNWQSASQLMEVVKKVGEEVQKVEPTETVPRNMVLRLLKVIRDEYRNAAGQPNRYETEESLHTVMIEDDVTENYDLIFPNLKEAITDSLNELTSELETSAEIIASQSLELIYTNEVVMTMGRSRSVETFLTHAAKNQRKFQVIVAEGAPFCNGHELACSLSAAGISTTLIPDTAIFSVMSKVNKVVIGTHSVMANGGLKAVSGAYAIALAAKHYSVPFIVCAAMFKLTPLYLVSHDQVAFNKFASPNQVLSYTEGGVGPNADVVNPVFDYVPPELVTVLVSNIGGNSPSYIYRLLSELYHKKDYLSQ